MAKVKFKTGSSDVIKQRYMSKKLLKWIILGYIALIGLSGGCIARLYYLRDLDPIIAKITTYYIIIESFIKGLF